jgi:hypothetical protein
MIGKVGSEKEKKRKGEKEKNEFSKRRIVL